MYAKNAIMIDLEESRQYKTKYQNKLRCARVHQITYYNAHTLPFDGYE